MSALNSAKITSCCKILLIFPKGLELLFQQEFFPLGIPAGIVPFRDFPGSSVLHGVDPERFLGSPPVPGAGKAQNFQVILVIPCLNLWLFLFSGNDFQVIFVVCCLILCGYCVPWK